VVKPLEKLPANIDDKTDSSDIKGILELSIKIMKALRIETIPTDLKTKLD
jgi:hypothetical protein